MGFNNDDEIRAIVEEVHDLNIIKERIANGRAKVTGEQVMKADEQFKTRDRAGIRRNQMANKAGQDFLRGEAGERFEMAKENVEQQMVQDGTIGGWGNRIGEFFADGLGIGPKMGAESTREAM
jgi:hypothetical protein